MSPQLRFGGRSDVGLHRHNNQDSMYAGPHLIAVADGVGGAAGGEVASRLTISALTSFDTDTVSDPQAALRQGAELADTSIRETVARDTSLVGMSTTLTAILATDDQLTLAHIGDSRAYLLRDGALTQLTHDHTLVQSLIDAGEITEAEAETHPRRSWIMRALDGRGQPDLDVTALDVHPGDRYLVCSDGLSSYVSAADIEAGLAGADPQAAAERLTDLALQAGGPDNITCVVADPVDDAAEAQTPILGGAVDTPPPPGDDATGPPPEQDARAASRSRGVGRRLAAVAAVVVILIAAGVAVLAVYIHRQWYVAPASGQVAIYQGVQGSAAGITLSHVRALTDIPVSALPQDDRDRISDGISAANRSAASTVVDNLRQQACATTPTPTPDLAATPAPKPQHSQGHGTTPRVTATPTPPPPPAWCTVTGQ